jgi:hypothetical protein
MKPGCEVYVEQIYSPPILGRYSDDSPFMASQEDFIHVIELQTVYMESQPEVVNYTMIVKNSCLLALAAEHDGTKLKKSTQWADWGPKNTRLYRSFSAEFSGSRCAAVLVISVPWFLVGTNYNAISLVLFMVIALFTGRPHPMVATPY